MWLACYGNVLLAGFLLLLIWLLFRAGWHWYQDSSVLMAISEGKGFSARRKSGVVLMAGAGVAAMCWLIWILPEVSNSFWALFASF